MRKSNVYFMVAVLLAYIVQGAIWYTMPLLFSLSLSNNYLDVGLLVAIVPLIEVMAGIPFGYMADFGKIKTIILGSMLALLIVPLMFAVNVGWFNAFGVFMLGIAGIGVWVGVTAYVANVMGKRGIRYIGYEFALMEGGWITGPIIGGIVYSLIGTIGLSAMELLVLGISSFIFLKTVSFRTRVLQKRAPKLLQMLKIKNRVFRDIPKFVIPFVLLSFIYSFFTYVVWIAVPLLVVIQKGSVIFGGLITGMIGIPYVIGDTLAGKLYKKKRERGRTNAALMLAALFFIFASFMIQTSVYSLLILFVSGLFVAFADVGIFSVVIEKARKDTGQISALSIISGGLGAAFGSIVVGATIAAYQLYVVAAIFGLVVLLYITYMRFVFGRSRF